MEQQSTPSPAPRASRPGQSPPVVQRQIVLPMRKAVEIAYKNIRMRLSRSLLVTSGIVLALSFLMAIRTNEAMVNAMRQWIARATDPSTPEAKAFASLQSEADRLDAGLRPLRDELKKAAATPAAAPKGQLAFNMTDLLGAELTDLQKELGGLPGPSDGLSKALQGKNKAFDRLEQWIKAQRDLKTARQRLGVLNDKRPAEGTKESEELAGLPQRIADLEAKTRTLGAEVSAAAASPAPPPKGQRPAEPRTALGASLEDLAKEFGSLPASNDALAKALAGRNETVERMEKWIAAQRQIKALRNRINGPKQLEAIMVNSGVPTDPVAVKNSKVQTRWLLGLALLVAFVGILNAMLMSVTERFREIGTMKCLGALDTFIVKLFLIESLFQGSIGTFLGIVIGLVLSLAGVASTYGEFAWKNFPVNTVLSSVALCMLVGMGLTVAGAVYPAWQAAKMQPVEAMRVET